ncbi:hypothetical protein GCM10010273_54640 [Streptomyces lavendulocolor]
MDRSNSASSSAKTQPAARSLVTVVENGRGAGVADIGGSTSLSGRLWALPCDSTTRVYEVREGRALPDLALMGLTSSVGLLPNAATLPEGRPAATWFVRDARDRPGVRQ